MRYLLFILLTLSSLIFPIFASAQQTDFGLTGTFIYEFTGDGVVKVREEISIRNLKTEVYAPSFTFDVSGFTPTNVVAYENGVTSKLVEETPQKFGITFKNPVLGKGLRKTAALTFDDQSLARKRGEVWEVHIPKVQNAEQFEKLTTLVRIPKELASKFHIFPGREGTPKGTVVEYVFDSDVSKSQPITAFLGDVAAYDFSLKYPLSNTSRFSKEISFAIPPDTAFQKVYLKSISEKSTLSYDLDGNWIAKVMVPPMQTKTIDVSGTIFAFAKPLEDFPKPNAAALEQNKNEMPYWETSNAQIVEIAKTHRTPGDIYKYVVETLSYDYAKTTRPQERLGALRALAQKDNAICMEFTDLFIAIARAAGIPAREINGFALSDDNVRPRELGLDILHSWPEYWDNQRQLWIPVDPTWGDTTGGVDYFSHLDLSHLTFVIHGTSSIAPQTPGTYKVEEGESALISVSASQDPTVPEKAEPTIRLHKGLGVFQSSYELIIENNSSQALYNIPVTWRLDQGPEHTDYIAGLLPSSEYVIAIPISGGLFGNELPETIHATAKDVRHSISVSKGSVQLAHIVLILLPLMLVPAVIFLFLKKR